MILEPTRRPFFLAAHPIPLIGVSGFVVNKYQKTDTLVHVSVHEGIPNAVVEEMACGLPIVVSRVSGLPQIVERAIVELPVILLIQWI